MAARGRGVSEALNYKCVRWEKKATETCLGFNVQKGVANECINDNSTLDVSYVLQFLTHGNQISCPLTTCQGMSDLKLVTRFFHVVGFPFT